MEPDTKVFDTTTSRYNDQKNKPKFTVVTKTWSYIEGSLYLFILKLKLKLKK